MITIDWASFGIGTGCVVIPVIAFIITSKIFKRRPRYDLNIMKSLVYDTGIKTKEVYENIRELEKVFRDIEGKK